MPQLRDKVKCLFPPSDTLLNWTEHKYSPGIGTFVLSKTAGTVIRENWNNQANGPWRQPALAHGSVQWPEARGQGAVRRHWPGMTTAKSLPHCVRGWRCGTSSSVGTSQPAPSLHRSLTWVKPTNNASGARSISSHRIILQQINN